jgi:PAS domain S-box-containing protein
MKDEDKTQDQLIAEVRQLRERIAELEQATRHAPQDAAAESEARAKLLLETTHLAVYECDTEGVILWVNPAAERLLGHPKAQILGVRIWDRMPPGPQKDALPGYLKRLAVEQPPPTPYIAQVVPDAGPPITIEVEWSYQRNPAGVVIGFVCVVSDVTDRQRAEAEVAKHRAILQAMVESLPFDFYAVGADGRYLLENAACRANWGRIVGKTPEDMAPDAAVRAMWLENNRRAFAGEKVESEAEVTIRGEQRVVYQVVSPIRDASHFYGILGVNVDITRRKRAEEALQKAHDELEQRVKERTAQLRESERRFRNYFEQGLIGMAVTSVDKRWVEVNDRLCEMLGYSREELLQTSWVALTHPDDVGPNFRLFDRLMAGDISHFILNKRFLRKDGRIVYTTIHTRAFRKEDGTVDHIVTLLEDITERHKAQEALQRERQSLWHMLQASDHERRIISYEIHDGLAQYLAAAGMQFQVFDHLRESNPEEAKKAYDAAIQLVSQSHFEARRLISDVRPPVIDEIGLETAISHLVHEQRRRGGPKVELHSKVQFDRLPAIVENCLYRIVQEALTNACNHSHSKEVKVTLTQDGPQVRLEVQDWGTGFDPEKVEKGRFGVEGIRQRVRLLGGELKIDSRPGSGTRIEAVVPIVELPGPA